MNLQSIIETVNNLYSSNVYSAKIWDCEPNSIMVVNSFTLEIEAIFQSDNSHTLYNAVRCELRRKTSK